MPPSLQSDFQLLFDSQANWLATLFYKLSNSDNLDFIGEANLVRFKNVASALLFLRNTQWNAKERDAGTPKKVCDALLDVLDTLSSVLPAPADETAATLYINSITKHRDACLVPLEHAASSIVASLRARDLRALCIAVQSWTRAVQHHALVHAATIFGLVYVTVMQVQPSAAVHLRDDSFFAMEKTSAALALAAERVSYDALECMAAMLGRAASCVGVLHALTKGSVIKALESSAANDAHSVGLFSESLEKALFRCQLDATAEQGELMAVLREDIVLNARKAPSSSYQ